MKKIVVGLTGGIASGKSEAAKIFASLGAYIIDADVVSRKVTEPGSEGEKVLIREFPFAFENGIFNRRALREYVFNDDSQLAKLNALTHGLILEEISRQIRDIADGFILVVVPLLFETGFDKTMDCVVCVTSELSVRIARLKTRDNINDSLASQMIANQLSDKEREEKADYIIHNDGDFETLRRAVSDVYEKIIDKE